MNNMLKKILNIFVKQNINKISDNEIKNVDIFSISKNANPNYLAKIVELKQIVPHPDPETTKIKIAIVDFEEVVIGTDMQIGDMCVYFKPECQINEKFLSFINAFRHAEKNQDQTKVGFFEDSCRVRTVKLRKQISIGFLVPIHQVIEYCKINKTDCIDGLTFDTICGELFVKKYIIKTKESHNTQKQGKKPRISRLVEGQYHLHVDTENLKYNIQKIKPEDDISITYKLHGTSWICANVLGNRSLNLVEKFLNKFHFPIITTEYSDFFGSRRVVKNEYETKENKDFYEGDLWQSINERVSGLVPKGFTLYGECVGFTKTGSPIQQGYDYGCGPTENRIYVYRITQTNKDGFVTELSTSQIQEFCNRAGLNYVPLIYKGKAKDLYPEINGSENWHEEFIKKAIADFTDKNCYMCKSNVVPEEGAVLRVEGLFSFKAYKLKSPKFLERETKLLDDGISDLESEN